LLHACCVPEDAVFVFILLHLVVREKFMAQMLLEESMFLLWNSGVAQVPAAGSNSHGMQQQFKMWFS